MRRTTCERTDGRDIYIFFSLSRNKKNAALPEEGGRDERARPAWSPTHLPDPLRPSKKERERGSRILRRRREREALEWWRRLLWPIRSGDELRVSSLQRHPLVALACNLRESRSPFEESYLIKSPAPRDLDFGRVSHSMKRTGHAALHLSHTCWPFDDRDDPFFKKTNATLNGTFERVFPATRSGLDARRRLRLRPARRRRARSDRPCATWPRTYPQRQVRDLHFVLSS